MRNPNVRCACCPEDTERVSSDFVRSPKLDEPLAPSPGRTGSDSRSARFAGGRAEEGNEGSPALGERNHSDNMRCDDEGQCM